MVRITIILYILCQSDDLVTGQRQKRGTLNGLVISQIILVKYTKGHIWQKLTNSKILKSFVKLSCFLVDLTILDPLTKWVRFICPGSAVTIL